MLRLIFLLVFVANLNHVLTDQSSYSQSSSYSSSSSQSSESSSSSSSSSSSTSSSSQATSFNCGGNNNNGQCGQNEVYDICPSSCPPRTCATKDAAFRCKEPLKPGDPKCPPPTCRCADGFYKNNEGKCVTKEQCPPTCRGPNEVLSDCANSPCIKNCATKDLNYQCRPDPSSCKPGCVCADTYFRNDNGTCVPANKCPPKPCGQNEVYESCPKQSCVTCENVGKPVPCPLNPHYKCKGQCVCKPGFYRNKIGQCQSEENCKKCQGQNEYFSCDNACDNECDKLSRQNHTNCPIINIKCNDMCYCDEGYARNASNICIPISQCPPECKDENEEYSYCPNEVCQPKTCDEVGFPLSCYQFNRTTSDCGQPRCICKGGFVRNKDGVCISARDCPSCGGDPNAWSGCGTFCKRCSNYKNENIACILICKLNSCDCRPDYVYDADKKKCVLPSQCPVTCGKNEVPSNCVNNPCLKKNCAQKNLNIQCKFVSPKTPSPDCQAGCLCVDGYLRADNGTCVPIDQCPQNPPKCGQNEVYDLCPSTCPPRTCETKDRQYKCAAPLEPGDPNCKPAACVCAENYYRNKDGKCVTKEECSNCGLNEVPSDCINGGCDKRNCSQVGRPDVCINLIEGACIKGCVCRPGYLRTAAGVCVPIDKCPSKEVCSKRHEYYDICPASCPARQCGIDDRLVRCKAPSPTDGCNPPSCRCEEGYYRNVYGDCVTFEECNINCGPDEIYYPCPVPSCAAQTCENIGKSFNCPNIPANYTCKGECRCRPGFYKNKFGQCVSEELCKRCQGPNEYPACDNACDNECDKLSKQSHKNCPIQNIVCNQMCYCDEGYARNASNICIPISQCPPECKDENEEYSYCPNEVCRPKTCNEVGFPLACYEPNKTKSDCGQPRCICKEGFVRNKNGNCISTRDCPSCGGDPNAWAGCGTFCKRCSNYKNGNIPCIRLCRVNSCDCRPDYVYDADKKKCVLPSQCPPTCGKNEVPSNCVNNPCLKKNCAQKNLNIQCKFVSPKTPSPDCQAGCLCVDGYLRDDNGTCVPIDQCPSNPSQCGQNEVYDLCPSTCPPRTCETKDRQYKCAAPLKPGDPNCNPAACVCAENFYRNKDGKCVSKEECSSCGLNEVPSDCINGGCDKRNCSQVGRPAVCIDLIQGACIKGCVCRPGYLRTAAGVCVPIDKCPSEEVCSKRHEYYDKCPASCPARQCGIDDRLVLCKAPSPNDKCNPPSCRCEAGYYRNVYGDCVTFEECSITCGENQIYYPCPVPSCAAQTCENVGKRFNCPNIPANYTCKGECRCQPNFYKNKFGQCVSEELCKKCRGPNEYPACDNACDNECDKLSKQSHKNCPIQNIVCNQMCYCDEGYARNASNICIPISQCPPECKDENAEYSDCPNKQCRPMTCDELGFPLACYKSDYDKKQCGKPRCICKPGFVMDRNGKCISSLDCPSCGGDVNAVSGCGSFCTRCTNYKNKARACPASCILNGCECRQNYVYDANKKKCVLPEQCPLLCGPNEVGSDCANDPCILKNCTQKDLQIKCKPKTCGCKRGCVCAEGYLRADNGTCIKRSQCPPICPANEVPSDCINGGCGKWNCSQLAQPVLCIDLIQGGCIKGCVCKKGYLRTAAGVCVPNDECPSNEVCPLQHEYYDKCPPSCPARQCGIDDRTALCPRLSPNATCNPSCRCEAGYYRNIRGECVTFEECSQCPTNEEYLSKPKDNCRARTCDDLGFPLRCLNDPDNKNVEKPGCYCTTGYVRNNRGVCIPSEQCPSCGGDPNAEPGCGTFCIRCSNYQSKGIACPAVCQLNGCECRQNYVYEENSKKCVAKDKCPSNSTTPGSNPESDFNKGNELFTAKLLNAVVQKNPGISVIVSAYSVLLLLAQLALFAKGNAYVELMDALNLKHRDEIKTAMPMIMNKVDGQKNVTLRLANRNYGSILSNFSEAFKKETLEIFGAEAENIDFSNAQRAADYINAWVEKVTYGEIKNLIPPTFITPDTELVMVNALFFLAEWASKFNPDNTRPGEFFVSSTKSVTLDMMHQTTYLKYGELPDLKAKAVELPYVNRNLSCLIILPNDRDGVQTLVSQLVSPGALTSIRDTLQFTRVELSLPKFNTTTTTDLKILEKIGLTQLFKSGMNGIMANGQNVRAAAGIQKAIIQVNESGSKAAAASAIVVVGTSAVISPPEVFNANQCFVYYLLFNGTPWFSGLFAGDTIL